MLTVPVLRVRVWNGVNGDVLSVLGWQAGQRRERAFRARRSEMNKGPEVGKQQACPDSSSSLVLLWRKAVSDMVQATGWDR